MDLIHTLQYLAGRLGGRLSSERGAITIEYGVVVVFIALALIGVVGVLVGGVSTWFSRIGAFIGATPDPS
jgi:Flp pilus assembly pilin Flp